MKKVGFFLLGLTVGIAGTWAFLSYRYSFWPLERDRGGLLERPATWAVAIDKGGLPNLYRVSEDLYRGAQPRDEGFAGLEGMGIKTVVNLRMTHSDRDAIEGTNLSYEHIDTEAWDIEDEDVVKFLKTVADRTRTLVFVHCKLGADRTGAMTAAYRVVVQGWNKEEAIREMTKGGFGYHSIWKDPIEYIRGMDVERMKRDAGLSD